jgi:hypothetical protein
MRWVSHVDVWKRWDMYTVFLFENLKEGVLSEDPGVQRRRILKSVLKK